MVALGLNFLKGLIDDRRTGKNDSNDFIITGSKSAVEVLTRTLKVVQEGAEDVQKRFNTLNTQMDSMIKRMSIYERWFDKNGIHPYPSEIDDEINNPTTNSQG